MTGLTLGKCLLDDEESQMVCQANTKTEILSAGHIYKQDSKQWC